MKTIFAIDSYRHRTEIVDAIVVIVAIIVTGRRVLDYRSSLTSEYSYLTAKYVKASALSSFVWEIISLTVDEGHFKLECIFSDRGRRSFSRFAFSFSVYHSLHASCNKVRFQELFLDFNHFRLVNGVATLIITNLERKQDELKLKYKTELEKSTIMLLLHSMDEYEAKKKKDENTRPSVVAEITPVEHFNASCSLSRLLSSPRKLFSKYRSSSENENSSELQRRVTSTVKQMSIRNKKKNQKSK